MRPAKPHLVSQWDRYRIDRPFLAHAPRDARIPLGSDCATVPSEKKGWRLWCFHDETARDNFVNSHPQAVSA